MSNTCLSCRFRGPEVVHLQDEPSGSGVVAVRTGYAVCLAMRHMGAVRVGAGEVTVTGAAPAFEVRSTPGVADRSGHGASLCITDDFGCNRWQPA